MLVEIALIVGAYLLGSLPVLHWIGRARGFNLNPRDEDLHQALWRKVGCKEGVAGVAWDVVKGPIPPFAAWLLDFDPLIIGLSGIAVTCGQMWPVFSRCYSKERGNTTGFGAALAIAPLTLGFALIPVAIGGGVRIASTAMKPKEGDSTRLKFPGVSDSMPLGMLSAFLVLPLAAWLLDEDVAIIWTFVALFAVIVLRRLTADLKEDLDTDPSPNILSVLKNRLLYDRSHH